jgi:hypothetical protein
MRKSTWFGFVNRRALGVLLCLFGLVLAIFATRKTVAQDQSAETPVVRGIYRGLSPVVKFDVSPPLRSMQIIAPGTGQLRENEDRDIVPFKLRFAPEWDPVVQPTLSGTDAPLQTEIPPPIVTFNAQAGTGSVPPDPNGTVGPNHIFTICNLTFQIFDKTGTSLFGPAANNTIWSGFGGACQVENAGDPVVLYDHDADRWFVMQLTAAGPTFFSCVAVSQTNDPTGSWFRYAISTGNNFPDYPKASVWPDAYYLSTREFTNGTVFAGVGAYALNRAQALAGNPNAQVISFLAPPNPLYAVGDGLLPSDWDGPTAPPAGSPNYYLGSQDNNASYGAPFDALNLYKFHADFANPPASSFILTNTIPVAAFNSILALCGGSTGRACIPQPNTTVKIDHLGYRQRPLFRLAYRNFGDHESLVTNQSVSAGNGPNGEVSGIRWYELRSPNSNPVIFQQGTYAPGLTDGIHRWMGSIAMDGQGNMALGYSASNGSNPAVFPSVNYTGRLANDPLGTLPQGEGSIVAGTGSQTTTLNRWGDYTSISIDPTDDLTFWYVNEWYPVTSVTGWRLRVGSFKLGTESTLNLLSAASRLTHGRAGTFDIAMPLSGTSGVECRSASTYNAVFTFDAAVTSGEVTVLSGTATVGTITFSGNSMMAELTGVSDQQILTLHTENINGDGQPHGDVQFGFLIGDANGDRGVTKPDQTQVKGQLNQPVTSANFRDDLTVDGRIKNSDVNVVKTNRGHSIP